MPYLRQEATVPARAESELTVPVALGGLVAPKLYGGSTHALVQVQGGAIRFKTTNPAVTATTGRIAGDLTEFIVDFSEIDNFSAVVSAGTPKLWIVWF